MSDDLEKFDLNPEDFEIIHEPLIREGETPFQSITRLHPGHNWSSLENISWDDVYANEAISLWLGRLIGLSTKPAIVLRRKTDHDSTAAR